MNGEYQHWLQPVALTGYGVSHPADQSSNTSIPRDSNRINVDHCSNAMVVSQQCLSIYLKMWRFEDYKLIFDALRVSGVLTVFEA